MKYRKAKKTVLKKRKVSSKPAQLPRLALNPSKSLHESEIRYRRLFEAAQDGILILDAGTGRITDVNPFLVKLLGRTREKLLGKKLWEIGLFQDVEKSVVVGILFGLWPARQAANLNPIEALRFE